MTGVSTGVVLFLLVALGGVVLYMRWKNPEAVREVMTKAASISKPFFHPKVWSTAVLPAIPEFYL